jgi:glycine betaine/choline ABC-type transport system substrate-binding protein
MDSIRRKLLLLLGGVALLVFFAIGTLWLNREIRGGIVIGGKGSEGEILSEILAQLIEKDLGIPVKRKCQLESTFILFQALRGKQIDLYVEYTGTALTAILGKEVAQKSKKEIYNEVQEELAKWNIATLSPLGFQNRYALMMDVEVAKEYEISTLSDLALRGSELKVAFDQEFCGREEFEILKNQYNISFHHLKMMDHVLLYLSLNRGGCDLINGYSTDGFCRGLKLLEDDLEFFPSYEAVPIVRKEVLEKYEGLEAVIETLAGKISNEVMQEMNYEVEKNGEAVYNVEETFLRTYH